MPVIHIFQLKIYRLGYWQNDFLFYNLSMTKETKDIKIIPIFNQGFPGIWDDFLRIRVAAMKYNYDIQLSNIDLENARTALKRTKYPFAFGAYDDDKMVACIHGSIQPNTAEINHLYVLPEYQGQKIGIKLLQSAEAAISLTTNTVELISLDKVPFILIS